jgi:hypothetical protein
MSGFGGQFNEGAGIVNEAPDTLVATGVIDGDIWHNIPDPSDLTWVDSEIVVGPWTPIGAQPEPWG